jgi:hypothetical protein
MQTREKLAEALDLLSALMDTPRISPKLSRAHALIASALQDFFAEDDDAATIPMWFEDGPFPAA